MLDSKETCTPAGCAIIPISDHCQAYIHLKGLVDTIKETERLQTKTEKLNGQMVKLHKSMSIQDYETKVPVDVKQSHEDRLKQLTGEIAKVTLALETLSSIGSD